MAPASEIQHNVLPADREQPVVTNAPFRTSVQVTLALAKSLNIMAKSTVTAKEMR